MTERTIDDFRHSRLMYAKRIPPFGYIFITILLLGCAFLLYWSLTTQKSEIIISSGVVEGVNKNYIMVPYSGRISTLCIEEGQYVEEGELVLTVQNMEIDLQTAQLENQKKTLQQRLNQFKKLSIAIQENSNNFDSSNPEDAFFYNQFEAYQNSISQFELDAAIYQNYGYSVEQIEEEMQKNQAKVAEAYYSALQNIESQILNLEEEISNINGQLDVLSNSEEGYQVYSPTAGIVHMMGPFQTGMQVQASSAIASIAAELDEYIIRAKVSARNIPRLEEGDQVNFSISGLPNNLYPSCTGRVEKIDSDITIPTTSSEEPYFSVVITPDNSFVIGNQGGNISLSNGMVVEVQIIYNELTYFDYALNLLGIKWNRDV